MWTGAIRKAVIHALKEITLEFVYNEVTGSSEILLNGEHVEYLIRDFVVAEKVSEVAAVREVREFAVKQHKALGKQKAW